MHPAYSVIFFTTASGAGYGLLVLLAIFALGGLLPASTWLGVVGLGLALGLIGAGLMSSTFHLGRPERAINAFSQWRSSWLSREGVLAVLTFIPAGLFGIGWVFLNTTGGLFAWTAALAAILAILTVFSTAMIYASLKPIRQWNNVLTPIAYLTLGAMTGALLLVAVARGFGVDQPNFAVLAIALLVIGWAVKTAYWHHIDHARPQSNLGTATGLGSLGPVRLLEQPHTEDNFIMREMGFQIARKHAVKLRMLVHLFLFAIPLGLLIAAMFIIPALALWAAILAVLSAMLGIVTERWLFFAEATHTSLLYYGYKP